MEQTKEIKAYLKFQFKLRKPINQFWRWAKVYIRDLKKSIYRKQLNPLRIVHI